MTLYVPVATGQPVICPVALMLVPGGRPAADHDTACRIIVSAYHSWRLTAPPATLA